MNTNVWKKCLAAGIILLFIFSILIPSNLGITINKIATNSVSKSSNEYPFNNPPNEVWNKTYGGTDGDYFKSVQQTKDNGYIMVGSTHSYGAGGLDVWILKTDIDGNEVWNKTYGESYDQFGYGIRETTDGGFIITGGKELDYSGHFNTSLIRTDSEGNEIWNKTYVKNGCESCGYSVIEVDDGYLVMSTVFYIDSMGIWLVKTDVNGRVLWDTVLDDSAEGHTVIQTKNGDFVVVGGKGLDQVLLIKTDSNGTVLWRKTYDGAEGKDIKECDDGGFIIAGREHVCLIRTDEDGAMLWKKEYQWGGFDTALSVDLASDGGYILSGNAAPGSGCDMLVIKTDGHGNREWETHLGGPETDSGDRVIQSNDGTYVIAGLTCRSGFTYAWLVKLAPFQNQRPINPLLTGPSTGKPHHLYNYSMNATDPEGESLVYWFEWGDGTFTPWQGPYESGKPCNTSSYWNKKGTYTINAKAADVYGGDSDWVTLQVTMPLSYDPPHFRFLDWLLERFPHAFLILRYLMGSQS
jgi:hypothetical protein